MTAYSLSWFQSELSALKSCQDNLIESHKLAYLDSLNTRLSSHKHSANTALLKTACEKLEEFRSENEFANLKETASQQPDQLKAQANTEEESQPLHLADIIAIINNSDSRAELVPSLSQSLETTLLVQEQDVVSKGFPSADDEREQQVIEVSQELASMKVFREQIKYMDVDQLIERAINECPPNPGPHNPQMLALKTLTESRDLSEQYTRRFTLYLETMLWLEKNTNKLTASKPN